MLPTLSPQQTHERMQTGNLVIIDVRDTEEYLACSVPDAYSVPLNIIKKHPVPCANSGKTYVFTCQSGRRTALATDALSQWVNGHEAYILEGGTLAWQKAGLPVQKTHVPTAIFRQIQICAGLLVLLGVVGSVFWHPMYLLTAFVGAGLTFAGLSGFCGLGILLRAMPWNKTA